ncbi:MAG: alanine racemase [Candidatus Zapsychrus exili]|nr:alanine racemase [Candidatus Zapsychrus exili]
MILGLKKNNSDNNLAWTEIDLKAIKHNVGELKKLASKNKFVIASRAKVKSDLAKMKLLTVVKADAYGHGAGKIAKFLESQGVEYFGVSDLKEGIQLREAKIKKPILLFESTLPLFIKDIIKYRLTPTICSIEFAKELNDYALKLKKRIKVHIKVDTGMSRLGVWHSDAFDFIKKVYDFKQLDIYGIYTHFPSADTNKKFTTQQINILSDLVIKLDKKGMIIPFVHASNSMGLSGYKTNVLNLSRPGIMLYGLYPSANLKNSIKLKPALSVKSKIIFLKSIPKGRGVSYGQTFVAKKTMKIATIPIGYNDGYLRAFSNKANIIVKGILCPVIGNVTMDQIIVDVSKVKNPKFGMTVTILGREKGVEVSADNLALYANTINYEILCLLGNRLPKTYIK